MGSDGGGFNQNSGNIENPSPNCTRDGFNLLHLLLLTVFMVQIISNVSRGIFGSTAEENAKAAIRMRYSLMPYMYSYEHSAYETGARIGISASV